MKTQIQMYYEAARRIAARDCTFMDIMRGPNPLTPEEIDTLAEKYPERYGRYAGFGLKAKSRKS